MARLSTRIKVWAAHRLPACDEVTRLISAGLDRELSLRERVRLRLHLAICLWCVRYARQIRLIHAALRRFAGPEMEPLAEGEQLSPKARARLQALLAGGASTGSG